MPEKRRFLLSCEHGGNQVPAAYRSLFMGQQQLLESHAGYDAGALALSKRLAMGLQVPLVATTTTRLLVDLNRTPNSRTLFSEISRGLDDMIRQRLLDEYYWPYRIQIREKLSAMIANGEQAVHLSLHSFTPVWHGQKRAADLGLLYDPARNAEKTFCQSWKQLLKQRLPNLNIRCNYPYRGTADGLVRTLRGYFQSQDYLGIELEVNQALLEKNGCFPRILQSCLQDTLLELAPSD